ncbi:hypothetical protein P4555_07980 [Peribacillus frigoritolerans]|uniref:hypothetical protein n=1 Tax=Peribacillus frigoritolerans TaxID=450367 RepID=UPI002E1D0180|nr:hypothetical protein [Peribacillus frigoritolerans]
MEGILKRKMTMITVAVAFVAGGIYFFSQQGEDPADTEDIFRLLQKKPKWNKV